MKFVLKRKTFAEKFDAKGYKEYLEKEGKIKKGYKGRINDKIWNEYKQDYINSKSTASSSSASTMQPQQQNSGGSNNNSGKNNNSGGNNNNSNNKSDKETRLLLNDLKGWYKKNKKAIKIGAGVTGGALLAGAGIYGLKEAVNNYDENLSNEKVRARFNRN